MKEKTFKNLFLVTPSNLLILVLSVFLFSCNGRKKPNPIQEDTSETIHSTTNTSTPIKQLNSQEY